MILNVRQLSLTFSCIALTAPQYAMAQSILDRVSGQVKQQIEQEIRRSVPGLIPPGQVRPKQGTYGGIPNEGGQQNNNGGFDPNSFFRPGPGGISGNAGQTAPYSPPNNVYPSTNPSTNTAFREPPVWAGDFNGGTIKVRCPKNSSRAVNYQLVLDTKSFPYTMRPGESQSFQENRLWLIRYISGTEEVTYRLRGGNVYAFETSRGRTELFRVPENYQEFPEPPTRE